MPAFYDPWPERQSLILTEATPGSLVKSPLEDLVLAGPGQPDALTLHYDGYARTHLEVNTQLLTFTTGANLTSTAVTPGTWIAGPAKLASRPDDLPFFRITVPCQGLAQAKPSAVRWFAVTETQSAENVLYLGTTWPRFSAEVIGYGVEIDYIHVGPTPPNMSAVSDPSTPSPAPSVRANPWTSIPSPTRHYPDGWFLADRKSQQILGSSMLWLVTDAWRYKYALTP